MGIDMPSPLEHDLRTRIEGVLSGESTLRDFYNWFVIATLDVDYLRCPALAPLTYKIVHLFAELSAGDISPRQFKQDLRAAASAYVVTATPWQGVAGAPVATRNANDFIWDGSAAFVLERRREAALA